MNRYLIELRSPMHLAPLLAFILASKGVGFECSGPEGGQVRIGFSWYCLGTAADAESELNQGGVLPPSVTISTRGPIVDAETAFPESGWVERMKPLVLEIASHLARERAHNPILLIDVSSSSLAAAESAHHFAAGLLRGAVELPPREQCTLSTSGKAWCK